jgi:ABC-type nitrate/sulfonate/bicarbonate transport system ATPase subunit
MQSRLDVGAPEAEPLDFSGEREPGAAGRAAVRGIDVRLRSLSHSFGALRAIEHLDLESPAGGVVGLVGPSGCGKSTLLELVAGLREPTGGSIEVGTEGGAGARLAGARLASCAYMPQRDLLLPWLSALDNASLALRVAGRPRGEARRATAPLFERFGLSGFEGTYPAELSGGMRQRVAFLRTLMTGKPVLLLDEPFASLDAITRAEMQSWLAGVLAGDPHTVLLVSHDVEETLYLSDRVVVLTARPARTAAEVEAPEPRAPDRPAAVTAPEFARRKERALRALEEGSR